MSNFLERINPILLSDPTINIDCGVEMKSVTVLGEKYKITSKIPRKHKDEIVEELYHGVCIPDDAIIWLNPKLEGKNYWRTLIHEVGHATMEANGLRYTNLIGPEIEEIIVESNAKAMYELFRGIIKELIPVCFPTCILLIRLI